MIEFPDYPFASRWFSRNGLRQHYLDEGTGDPVLMLHGNPSWSYYYRHLIRSLRGSHRCIVPDHIGMGWSDKPPPSRYNYHLSQRVDDLDALLQHLGNPSKLTLVLHDWGGMIGMAWACRHPQLVKRLVILNTAAFPNPKGRRLPWALRLGRDSRLGAWLILKHNAFARGAARFGVVRAMDPVIRSAYLAPYDTPEHRISTLYFVKDIPLAPTDRGFDLVQSVDAQLGQFANRPALICWGLRDFVFDRHFLRVWQEKLPTAQTHAFADAGHYVLEDAHERIVPLVKDFLERHPLVV